jgi:hypothetical protein
MNTLFEHNMAILRKRLPIPAAEIDRSRSPEDRRAVISKQGVVSYQFLQDGVWRSLTSAYDPWREAQHQFSEDDLKDAKIIFVLGEAGLYHLEAVLKKAPEQAKVMLMSQRPDYLRLVLESRDVADVLADERLVIVTSPNMEYIKAGARGIIMADLYDVPTFSLVIHPIEMRLQEDFVYSFQQALHWLYTIALTGLNTTQYFEHWWSQNFVMNIPYLLTGTGVSRLAGTWSGKPVVIVGAGPSLNKNLHLLKQVQGKALILCVDTAYRILQKAQITPDLLVTLDGSPMNAQHMEGCDYSHVPLFFDEYSHWNITTAHRGPKIVNSNGLFHRHWWNRVYNGEWHGSSVATGGSVATTAFSIARLMDANPVIMVGVDLSYPEGKLYADGALRAGETVESIQSTRRFIEVEDIYGRTVYTTHDYMVYLRWLEMEAKKRDRLYINATEGGALKNGFKLMSMSDCIDMYCREDQPVESWKQQLSSEPVDTEKFSTVLRNLKRSKRELKAAVRYLQKLTSLAETYHSLVKNGEIEGISELAAEMRHVQSRLVSLPFAMGFLDAHSFQAVYNDIKLAELTKFEKGNMTQREHAVTRAIQMVAFFTQLKEIAKSSVDMHVEGIRQMTEFMRREEALR